MKISIIGAAGTLGSCTAFNILTHRFADELILLDPWKDMLKAQWMDLSTAVTWQNIKVRMGEYEDMEGSDIVVITAGAPHTGAITSRRDLLPNNLPIIKENAQRINLLCPKAIIITATNPVDPLNYAMYLLGKRKDRRKIIGYSLNDTFRFRNMVAIDLGVRPSRIEGMVIGEHDLSQVPLFSTLRLDGKPIQTNANFKQRILGQMANTLKELESLKPRRTTGWTTAVGIVAIIRSIINDVGETIPCNAVLDGEYGYRDISTTVPTVIGFEGIRKIKELELAPEEKEGLEKSVQTLSPYMRMVEQDLGILSVR